MFEARNDTERQTCHVRMRGAVGPDEMREFAVYFGAISASYRGAPHLCVLDLRGLRPLEPEAAVLLSRTLARAREGGLAYLAHVSDETAARLAALGVGGEESPDNAHTLDCASVEVAERALQGLRAALLTPPTDLAAAP
jgi:hypothetical protein